jgi:hypothetical protein
MVAGAASCAWTELDNAATIVPTVAANGVLNHIGNSAFAFHSIDATNCLT